MLNGHPRIAIPGETWYFFDVLDKMRREIIAAPESAWRHLVADKIENSATFPTLGVTSAQLRSELGRLSRGRWSDILAVANLAFARAEGKERWGDKTPGYVRHLPDIKRLFPGAFVIHVIRDGRDVAASYLEQQFGPNSALDAAIYWKSYVLRGLEDGPPLFDRRYFEIRYENLASKPEPVLRALCERLEEDFDPAMLDNTRSARKYIRPGLAFHKQTSQPVTTARIHRWRSQLTNFDAQLVELEAGALLRRLGYATETRKGWRSVWRWRHRLVLGIKVRTHQMLTKWGVLA
jgi:hypothetical protein